jgi:hypothetical protein
MHGLHWKAGSSMPACASDFSSRLLRELFHKFFRPVLRTGWHFKGSCQTKTLILWSVDENSYLGQVLR